MSHKEYSCGEYFAQEFTKFVKDANKMGPNYGGGFPARHHSINISSFKYTGVESHVIFSDIINEKFGLVHEMELTNGEGIKRTKKLEGSFRIKRSNTERISGKYFYELLDKFLIKNILEFCDEYSSKSKQ